MVSANSPGVYRCGLVQPIAYAHHSLQNQRLNHITRDVDCGFAFIECQIDLNHSDGLRQCEYDYNLIKRGLRFRCFDLALQRLALACHMGGKLLIGQRFT